MNTSHVWIWYESSDGIRHYKCSICFKKVGIPTLENPNLDEEGFGYNALLPSEECDTLSRIANSSMTHYWVEENSSPYRGSRHYRCKVCSKLHVNPEDTNQLLPVDKCLILNHYVNRI
jgi:DNA-directed RNA polymerase subunit RPC12/RpoP